MITLSGNLQTIAGDTAEAGQVIVQLCGYGSQIPRVPGLGILARTKSYAVAVNGSTGMFSVPLPANDTILPAGTYYTVDIKDSNGNTAQINAYRLTGQDRTLDLSTLAPFDPTALAPPSIPVPNIVNSMVAVPWSPAVALSGAAGLAFEVGPMQGDTVLNFAAGVPGNLYVFITTQASDQARALSYGATIHGGSPANPQLGHRLVQAFVCRADGSLDSIGGGTYL